VGQLTVATHSVRGSGGIFAGALRVCSHHTRLAVRPRSGYSSPSQPLHYRLAKSVVCVKANGRCLVHGPLLLLQTAIPAQTGIRPA
jgi:hypothetical protein